MRHSSRPSTLRFPYATHVLHSRQMDCADTVGHVGWGDAEMHCDQYSESNHELAHDGETGMDGADETTQPIMQQEE
jgi:hypothetical protein